MIYNNRNQLTIISLSEDETMLALEQIKQLIMNTSSSIIYCEKNGELHGIITPGDVYHAIKSTQKHAVINTRFTSVKFGEEMRARNIFAAKETINAIPVLNEDSVLIGEWSRYDDLKSMKYLYRLIQGIPYYKNCQIAVVYPSSLSPIMQNAVDAYCRELVCCGAEIKFIKKSEVIDYIDTADYILFANEGEAIAYRLLCAIMERELNKDTRKLKTYRNFIFDAPNTLTAHACLFHLQSKGIHIFNLYFKQDEYYHKLNKNIRSRYYSLGGKNSSSQPTPEMFRDFYGDLYTEGKLEQAAAICQYFKPYGIWKNLKDCHSIFCNVTNGERYTQGQPSSFENTIFFTGPCFVFGLFVEDKHTITSKLQDRLNSSGYKIKVINYGGFHHNHDLISQLGIILNMPLKKGDTVICASDYPIPNVFNINLTNALKNNHINIGWFSDDIHHCNDKINMIYADTIFKIIKPFISKISDISTPPQKLSEDFRATFDNNPIKLFYIDQYFRGFTPNKYHKIGSIVMNCNPFTLGHRYLIEQALNVVDFLIIFAVEEDKSVFSFNERFTMICEGVADIQNVMVVPSGPFILSQTTFPEYFIKKTGEDLIAHVENDITLFAEKIAPLLNITYRFVGEELTDEVTNEYNLAMKHILPKYGIHLIEIPRKKLGDQCISATSVRKCLENNNMLKLKELVPDSTIRILTDWEYDKSNTPQQATGHDLACSFRPKGQGI